MSTDAFSRFWEAPDAVVATASDDVSRALLLLSERATASVLVFQGGLKLDVRIRVTNVGEGGFIALRDGGGPMRVGQYYDCAATGGSAVTAFRARLIVVSGDELHFTLPARMVHCGFRRAKRVAVEREEDATFSFVSPITRRQVSGRLAEVSEGGFSVTGDCSSDALRAGDPLTIIRLSLRGRVVLAEGVVRHAGPDAFGVQLDAFDTTRDRDTWRDFVSRLTHPRAAFDPRAAWQVLESSGYLALWAGEQDRTRLEQEHDAFWRAEGANTARVTTLMAGSAPVATMATTLLYPRTWMFHHLGVDRAARIDRASFLSLAREVYSAIAHELERVEFDYLMMFVEAEKGYSDHLYGKFARMYGRPEELSWSRNLVFRADTRRTTNGERDRRSAVRVATALDLELLGAHLTRTRSPMEILSHELDAEGLSSEGFARRFLPRHPVRERRTYVHAEGGQATWAVVCETGKTGANVFGLLNRCWLSELAPCDPVESSVARRALLRRAVRHFADAGTRMVVLLGDEAHGRDDALSAGFSFVSSGSVWLSRREVLPAWMAYVHDALSLPRGPQPSRAA